MRLPGRPGLPARPLPLPLATSAEREDAELQPLVPQDDDDSRWETMADHRLSTGSVEAPSTVATAPSTAPILPQQPHQKAADDASPPANSGKRPLVTEDDDKRIRRKTDGVILVILCWVYFLQILDKSVVGYSAVFGLQKDTVRFSAPVPSPVLLSLLLSPSRPVSLPFLPIYSATMMMRRRMRTS
jgi:hypothetical protein